MQKAHKEPHPVELALIVALAVAEALTVLVVALVALVLTIARWSPATPPEPSPTPPAAHPLALLAEQLQALPQRQLMALAGTRRKLPKSQLIGMVIACS